MAAPVIEISGVHTLDSPDGEVQLCWRVGSADCYIWLTAAPDFKVKPTLYRHTTHGLETIKGLQGDNARMVAAVMNIARNKGLVPEVEPEADQN